MNYYHYTDINGLKGILENKEIWLTDTRFLNDSTEGKEIDEYITKEIESNGGDIGALSYFKNTYSEKSNITASFVVSFSEKPDLLSQWRAYCPKCGGYSIGFKGDNHQSVHVNGFKCNLDDSSLKLPMKCIYDCKVKEDKVVEISKVILSKYKTDGEKYILDVIGQYMLYCCLMLLFKNENFREESELRFIAQVRGNLEFKPFVRVKSNYLVPYIKMTFEPEIVDKIIIGPTPNPDLAEIGLKEFLRSLGPEYKHIKINHSSIPYRAL